MIKICYPPGCYGNYLGQCLYFFTNLRTNDSENFSVDSRGSSHAFVNNTKAHQYIQLGHFISDTNNSFPNISISSEDVVIYITPSSNHQLDYYNNIFFKQYHKNLLNFISESFIAEEINSKLYKNWGYAGQIDDKVPRWILREFFSFFIGDVLHNTYKLLDINNSITLSTQSFFENFLENFKNLCEKLHLTITVNDSVILENNQTFIKAQCYYKLQLLCEQWIQCVIDNTPSTIESMTIFSEAYIQHRLRELGYHIQCNGMNVFPLDSQTMTKLIYKIL
jgi:hypothetical protein